MTRSSTFQAALLAALLLGVFGCGESRPPTMLAEYNVLVVTPDAMWNTVSRVLDDTLGVRPFGMQAEHPLQLTQRDPEAVTTSDLQRYRHVVVVGGTDVSFVVDALGGTASGTEVPVLSTSRDVWVAGQRVVVLALPDATGEEDLRAPLGEVGRILLVGLHDSTIEQMYAAGTHPEIDSATAIAGFGLDVPGNYGWRWPTDSILLVASRPTGMDPLLRSVLVTWRPLDEEEATPEVALDWREGVAPLAYEGGQITRRDPIEVVEVAGAASRGLQVSGFWSAIVDGELRGGPTRVRVVDCPDQGRRYLLDSWIYAPNRGKYRYLIQLEAILDSFRCSAN
jgi:hypothetical protein